MRPSLPPSYFDALYQAQPDPWSFETSPYEQAKYSATLAALPKAQYRSAFEIGCSIGVLTERLAQRCERLLAVDVAERALGRARERCCHLPHVQCELRRVPEEFPTETFDLVLVSEVGYYWSWTDLARAQTCILQQLEPGGHLLLIHWVHFAVDYPLNADEVHESFLGLAQGLQHLGGRREPDYRLDLFERVMP
ncbi:class I SAM-dependent methyltransferase [Candidatus Cyanaurora vandensis]|uniref:class I SAM-dependent DNA methyltransferase n=1 Tax=Candidatus Cyanaurora vandensis TaxID=2714958 RepID=UPI00257CE765|nr:SAM-dependent methyltransferase [Candidatus Cyanaurora vandensis]